MNEFLLRIDEEHVIEEVKRYGNLIWSIESLGVHCLLTKETMEFISSIEGVISVRKNKKQAYY